MMFWTNMKNIFNIIVFYKWHPLGFKHRLLKTYQQIKSQSDRIIEEFLYRTADHLRTCRKKARAFLLFIRANVQLFPLSLLFLHCGTRLTGAVNFPGKAREFPTIFDLCIREIYGAVQLGCSNLSKSFDVFFTMKTCWDFLSKFTLKLKYFAYSSCFSIVLGAYHCFQKCGYLNAGNVRVKNIWWFTILITFFCCK